MVPRNSWAVRVAATHPGNPTILSTEFQSSRPDYFEKWAAVGHELCRQGPPAPVCETGGTILADRSLSRLLKDGWPQHLDEL